MFFSRKRHWFDRGEDVSPRYFRNEPLITDIEIVGRLRWGLPIPRSLREEWEYVSRVGCIYSDKIGKRDVVYPFF